MSPSGIVDRRVLSEELAVPKGSSAGTVNAHDVLVELAHFSNCPGFVPLGRAGASLVLQTDMVANFQGWQPSGMGRPSLEGLLVAAP